MVILRQKMYAMFVDYKTNDRIDSLKGMKDSDILAEQKLKGRKNKEYNRTLMEAQRQAKRRQARDLKNNLVNREGYTF